MQGRPAPQVRPAPHVVRERPQAEILRAAIPTILLMVVALMLISYIPAISNFLPSLLF